VSLHIPPADGSTSATWTRASPVRASTACGTRTPPPRATAPRWPARAGARTRTGARCSAGAPRRSRGASRAASTGARTSAGTGGRPRPPASAAARCASGRGTIRSACGPPCRGSAARGGGCARLP
jgi:hypothetical protein